MRNPTNKYDALIRRSVEQHLTGHDWRLIKAQLIAESNLNPDAVSPAGAQGIAQFIPDTWTMVRKQMGLSTTPGNPFEPLDAIPACCFNMSRLLRFWNWPRPEMDRYCLALASYNAGEGNLVKAQKKANNASGYGEIIRELPQITGSHANETRNYVRKIMIGWLTISGLLT